MASDRVQRRIERLLDQVEEAIDQLDWEEVRGRAQAILRLDPDNSDALSYLAAAERDTGSSQPTAQANPAPSSDSARIPDQPTSFANGRYQVQRFLGEGGRKRVYLAHDTILDREVAFALIKTEGLDDTSRTRIQREAQAMGRLGSHPHIVTVFDLGEEQDQPYMVTELMGGGDVEAVIESAEDHRLPLEQAIKIAQETCRGMEFAHSRGIVHRDLKPGNVWLTEDGIAKIGDFGLAVALDRSRLTTEGMMVGTVSYMPPEQAMGGEVTPRSDLYSLGAMLYEMVTGRPPFLGDDSVAIIGQHINTPPVAPVWHNGQCPRSLDALILRLLAKDPSERPESASDVLSALDAIDVSNIAEQPAVAGDEAHALDSLAGGVFVGRQREMGELKAALEDALSGRGRLVTLVGEPGIGKTRTAQELATYAGLRQAQVLWGRCYEGQGAPPYWPWVQAIRSYVRDRDQQQLQSEMGAGAADIAEIVSDVGEQLPGLKPPPQLEPDQARFRLFDSITAFLKSAGRRQPLVLILEDLQWADQPSLLLLEFLARELAGARLLIVGTYRDVDVTRRHPLSLTLGELARERLFQRVQLKGLEHQDVGRFIELVAGLTPPRGMVEAVHRQTEGNPLFVTEVVRLLVQEGELTAHSETASGRGDTDSWSVRIPEGVREVIGRRLDHLSERCNQTLTIASVLGREFTLEQLTPLIDDLTEDRLLEVLEEALAARVLEELPRVAGRYQFTHALIQDTLLEDLSATRRVRLHARIAEAFEELYGDEVEAHAAALAYHLAAVGTLDSVPKMIYYSLKAGDRALATYAYEEALDHFERGLAAKQGQEMDSQTADLLLGLAKSKAATGQSVQVQDAWNSLSQAFDYYAEAGNVDQVSAIALYPFPLEVGVLATGAVDLIVRALTIVPADSREAGHLQARYGNALGLLQGDYAGAQAAFQRCLETAQRMDDPSLEMGALAAAAGVDWFHLHWQEAMEKSAKAIEMGKQIDEPVHQWVAHLWAVNSLAALGRTEEVRQRAEAIVPVAERLRHRNEIALAHALNARVSHLTGDWEASREFVDKALALSPRHTQALVVRIMVEYDSGNHSRGKEFLERLMESVRSTAPGPNLPRAYASQIGPMVARIAGRTPALGDKDAESQAILSSPSATPFASMLARMGLAMTAVAREDRDLASEQYEALKDLQGTAFNTSTDRLLGLLARTMGRLEDAESHFEDALAFCRRAGYRPELAWSSFDYAETILEEADGDTPLREERPKAMSLLDDALAISRELGMRPLMERVLARREFLSA